MAGKRRHEVAVIGGGPAGLIAAETLAPTGAAVTIYDRMPRPGLKLLLAGRGGLNLTHSEPLPAFLDRYGPSAEHLRAAIEAFPPAELRAWCEGLGEPTFVGSSGRVFPRSLKASPLLRAWLRRLDSLGVRFAPRHRWTGWTEDGSLAFVDASGANVSVRPDAAVLALGGASWPRTGSDGGWVPILRGRGIEVDDLAPANCGVSIAWSEHLKEHFAGAPLKRVALGVGKRWQKGEAVITAAGLEGGAVYALVPPLRSELAARGHATLNLDLRPDLTCEALTAQLARPRGKQSLANHLRKAAALPPVAIALLREVHGAALPSDPPALAAAIKSLPLAVTGLAPIGRAISSAGGVAWRELDEHLMLGRAPGVFVAGEMIDWEAPTGGYLLQACFSTGRAAAMGAAAFVGALQNASRPAEDLPDR